MFVQVADAIAQLINCLHRVVRSQQLHEHEWALDAGRRIDRAEHIAHRPVREHLPHIPELDVVRDVGDAHGRCGCRRDTWALLLIYTTPDWPHPLLGVEPALELGLALLRGRLPAATSEPVVESRTEVGMRERGRVCRRDLCCPLLGLQLIPRLLRMKLGFPAWIGAVQAVGPGDGAPRGAEVEVLRKPACLWQATAQDLLAGVRLRREPGLKLLGLKPAEVRPRRRLGRRRGGRRTEKSLTSRVAPLHVRAELAARAPLGWRPALVTRPLVVVTDVLILRRLLV